MPQLSDSINNETGLFSESDSQKKSDEIESIVDDPLLYFKNIVNADIQNKIDNLYEEFLDEARNEPILSLYQQTFEFIYQIAKGLIENEAKLKNIIELMKNNNKELNSKFTQAVKLSSTDQETIAKFRVDVENAWQTANKANRKEKRTRETVSAMKLEISNLTKLVEQGVGLTMGQEYNMHQILKDNEELRSEGVKLKEDIEELKKTLAEFEDIQSSVEKIKEEAQAKIQATEKEASVLKIELQQENRKVERLNEEIKTLKALVHEKESDILNLNKSLESTKNEIVELTQKNKDLWSVNQKLKKEVEIQAGRIINLQQESVQNAIRNDRLVDENVQLIERIKKTESSIVVLNNQIVNLQKLRDGYEKRIKDLEDSLRKLTNERLIRETEIEVMKKELAMNKKKKNDERAVIEKLRRERDDRDKKVEKAQNETRSVLAKIRDYEKEREFSAQKIDQLEKEILGFDKIVKKHEKEILLKEKKVLRAAELMNEVKDEVRLKELSFVEKDMEIAELQLKIEKIEKLYDALCVERNLAAKELMQVTEERENARKGLATLKNQQTLLIASKAEVENELKKVVGNVARLEKERESIKNKYHQLDKQLKVSQQVTNQLQLEQRKLLVVLEKADKMTKNQSKEISKFSIERCVLGSQLVRRNDEISLLYEKIKLLKITLNRGEQMYAIRLNDIQILKKEVIRQRSEIEVQTKVEGLIEKLRSQLRASEKEILNEKAKRNALEETQGKMNIHRWRTIQTCDPKKYELIVKVTQLQKRLIAKAQQLAEMQMKFQEKDRIFVELKKHFSRPAVSNDHAKEIDIIEKKTRKLKALIAEYNMMNADHGAATSITYI